MDIPAIFTVTSPSEWRPAPEWMNTHYLLRAERCPKSAALRYAKFGQLWNRNTYPDKPTLAALAGTVVHVAVARIVQQFAASGCSDINDPRCFAVLKELGGFSKILMEAIVSVSKTLEDNPRFEIIREWSINSLNSRIPTLRELVQVQLCGISWTKSQQKATSKATSNVNVDCMDTRSSVRGPLPTGTHFEVEVRYPKIKWRGIIDFLDVGDRSCAIKDFKTGEQSDDHVLQLKVYALLWQCDQELNPGALPLSRLAICHPSGEKEISLEEKELGELAKIIASRASKVRASITGPNSSANISSDHCPTCDVRHLCSDYWQSGRHGKVQVTKSASALIDDIEVKLKTRKGEKTWLAECMISNHFSPKSTILLRWSSPNLQVLAMLDRNMRVRFAGALVTKDEDTGFGLVHCLTYTDVILLDA